MRIKNFIRNVFSSLLLQLVTIICGFIIPILFIRTFGSDVNGLVSSITQFLAYITLLESGIGTVLKAALYKPISEKNNEEIVATLKSGNSFFKKIALIFILYIIVLCVAYPFLINKQFDFIYTASLVIIISISTFFEYYFGIIYRLFLLADQKNYVVSLIKVLTLVLNTILIIILVNFNCSIHIVKLVSSLIFLLNPFIQMFYVKKKYHLNLNDKNVKPVELKQKWYGLSQHIASVIHNNTDIVVLTIFCANIAEVSVYSIYLLIINGVKSVIESFESGMDSIFGDMYAKKEFDNLKQSFINFNFFFQTLAAVAFICCLNLIIPFVSVYTKGITDVNYIRPLFAILIVVAEFVYMLRYPFNSLILSIGHFKQTMKGAWIESFLNISISIILVLKYGLVGVAIGTLIAMLFRTIELMIYVCKNVIHIPYTYFIKNILVIIGEFALTSLCVLLIPNIVINSYLMWFIYAIIVFIITCVVVLLFSLIFYRTELSNVFKTAKLRKNS